jgi:hypothetical protein
MEPLGDLSRIGDTHISCPLMMFFEILRRKIIGKEVPDNIAPV